MKYLFYTLIISFFILSPQNSQAHKVAVCAYTNINSTESGPGAFCPSICETYGIENGGSYTWYEGQWSCNPQSDWPADCTCQCTCDD